MIEPLEEDTFLDLKEEDDLKIFEAITQDIPSLEPKELEEVENEMDEANSQNDFELIDEPFRITYPNELIGDTSYPDIVPLVGSSLKLHISYGNWKDCNPDQVWFGFTSEETTPDLGPIFLVLMYYKDKFYNKDVISDVELYIEDTKYLVCNLYNYTTSDPYVLIHRNLAKLYSFTWGNNNPMVPIKGIDNQFVERKKYTGNKRKGIFLLLLNFILTIIR